MSDADWWRGEGHDPDPTSINASEHGRRQPLEVSRVGAECDRGVGVGLYPDKSIDLPRSEPFEL